MLAQIWYSYLNQLLPNLYCIFKAKLLICFVFFCKMKRVLQKNENYISWSSEQSIIFASVWCHNYLSMTFCMNKENNNSQAYKELITGHNCAQDFLHHSLLIYCKLQVKYKNMLCLNCNLSFWIKSDSPSLDDIVKKGYFDVYCRFKELSMPKETWQSM